MVNNITIPNKTKTNKNSAASESIRVVFRVRPLSKKEIQDGREM